MKEALSLNYTEKDGILIPDIQISNDRTADEKPLGKYGQMAMNYLRDNHPSRYSLLLSEGELLPMMHRVNEEAYDRLDTMMEQMLKTNQIPNQSNTMESYRHREMLKTTAEEIILHELIYIQR